MAKAPLVKNQGAAIALGISSLLLAAWSFNQAWEARGQTRPPLARWLAM